MLNNVLKNKGDSFIIRIDSPIVPSDTVILGYFIHLTGIIDRVNIVKGEFGIVTSSQIESVQESDIHWYLLDKKTFESSDDSYFCNICNKQKETYYVYFKFTKVSTYPQDISLSKISLKLANRQNEDGSYGDRTKYPYYERSIFRKNNRLYAAENLKWAYNVLSKVRAYGIVPNFVSREKDFDIFWEWLCHFWAVVVNFARQFVDITEKEDLLTEYIKQKDIYPNTKISIYEIMEITSEGKMIKYIRPTEDILNIYEEFRVRGTKDTYKKIQTLLEATSRDLFYCDYLTKGSTAWYLNRYSPITTQIIDNVLLTKMENFSREYNFYNANLKLLENDLGLSLYYIDMNENNNIVINFESTPPASLALYVLLRTSELNADIYSLTSICKYSKVDGVESIEYNTGLIFIKGIDPRLKKVVIPIRFRHRLLEKINQGEFLDTSPLGRKKESFFFENTININDVEYNLDKIAIRQIVAYNEENPTAFVRAGVTENEKTLENTFFSINLRNTKADSIYYISEFSCYNDTKDERGNYFKAKLIIKEYPSQQEVCGFELENPTPRNGYIEILELNGSGITGSCICSLEYNGINIGETFGFDLKIDSNEIESYNLNIDYTLGRLPYNLNFLNLSYFWLNYIKNNSPYSFEELCDIINRKFMPYNAKVLFLQNDKIKPKIYPLVFTIFEIRNTDSYTRNFGSIYCKVEGGIGPYIFTLYDEEGKVIESRNNGNFEYVEEGLYTMIVEDSVGTKIQRDNILIKNISSIVALVDIRTENGEKSIWINIKGGISPYYLHYSQAGPILEEFTPDETVPTSSDYIKLNNIPFELNRDFYIYIADSSTTNFQDIENIYYITVKVQLETTGYIRLNKYTSLLNEDNQYSDKVGVSANVAWEINAPEHIHFNRTSGEGDSIILFNTDYIHTGRKERHDEAIFSEIIQAINAKVIKNFKFSKNKK